jgi:hypothetical protein
MSGLTFEQLRIPLALLLIIIVAFILLPGLGQDGEEPLAVAASPTPSIVVGSPGGAIISTPEPTPIPTVAPTPTVTPTPVPQDTFSASVFACAALSGSNCIGHFERMPRRLRDFNALVTFSDARAGDTISVVLSGPVTLNGGPYTLQGGGNGYYYSTFQARGLPEGDYTLTATRNGAAVASATFSKGG